METIATMDLTLYGALASFGVVFVTELVKFIQKKFKAKIPSQFIVLFLALILAFGYYSYTQFMPQAIQDGIYAFVAGSIGFATTIYTFLIKPVKNKIGEKDEALNA